MPYLKTAYHRCRHLLAVAAILFMVACTTVPMTNRQSFQMVPDADLHAMSSQQYRQVLNQSKLSDNAAQVRTVRRVGNRVARAAEDFLREQGLGHKISRFRWEFNLIEDDQTVNAWVMPGGKAAVYSGLLRITRDDTGLAVVLGHEVAHAIAGHGNERLSQGLLARMGATALAAALSQQPAATQELFNQAYGVGANVGILLPYSRLHETEADRIGLVLMARAGYDPRAAIPLWERMKAAGGPRPPEFISTHPAPTSRIQVIRRELPRALLYYRPQ
ncbi:MAG: M48 family metallopeptidase [Desulfobacterales bacterium]|nr:M48 family metallopeptidase [Desulfobacterales bacterium]